ncbi:MAG TPA: hypothetical protein PKY12_12850, partial [Catalimonadaceae bacterium]|nr:hypothetical protein [Catalimonadaceae bacterium]
SGRWSLVSGSGSITNPTQANSAVTGLGLGNNVFKWKVSNDPCPADSANVTITVNTIVQAIAGPDQTVCTTGVVVAGNFPPTNGTTRWTRLTGTGLVNSPNSRATAITLLGLGTSTYEYKITVPGCGDTKDTLAINRIAPPTTANAGQNQTVCTNSTTMQANSPTDGTGTWTLVSGTGSIAEPNNPATVINGLSVGDNVFQWTISNEPCTSSSQNVTITYQLPEVADVGPDISVCSTGVVLSANVAGINGGNWNLISGAGTISTFNNGMQAVINGLNPGPNVFEYETSTQCGLLKDTIIVTRFVEPVANAGANQNVCSTSATLNAAAPAIGTGRWTRVSGSGTVTNPTLRNSTVTGLGVGNNVFKWKVSNNPCPADSDNVTINYTPLNVPNAGNDVAVCTTFVTLVGSNRGTATATWSQIGGTAIISPFNGGQSAVVNGLSPGINEFIYTLSSAACGSVSDTVVVTRLSPQTANAGSNQVICSNSTSLNAAIPSEGSGRWSLVSGSGSITNPTQVNSAVTGLGLGNNVFKWKVSNDPCPADSANVTITVNTIV